MKAQSTSRAVYPNSDVDQHVPAPAEEPALPRIGAWPAVANDDVGARQQRQEPFKLADVELAVAIGQEDVVAGGRGEAGRQGGAVAAIDGVRDEPNGRALPPELLDDGRGRVTAAVVDDDDLVVVDQA